MSPTVLDDKYLKKFLQEYTVSATAYIICRTPKEYILGNANNIHIIPWQELHTLL